MPRKINNRSGSKNYWNEDPINWEPWAPAGGTVDKADDANPNPTRRTPGITWDHQIVPVDKIRHPDTLMELGYMDQNIGGEHAVPSDTPQAPGPRRGLYRYENKPGTSNPAPGKTGAGE